MKKKRYTGECKECGKDVSTKAGVNAENVKVKCSKCGTVTDVGDKSDNPTVKQ